MLDITKIDDWYTVVSNRETVIFERTYRSIIYAEVYGQFKTDGYMGLDGIREILYYVVDEWSGFNRSQIDFDELVSVYWDYILYHPPFKELRGEQ